MYIVNAWLLLKKEACSSRGWILKEFRLKVAEELTEQGNENADAYHKTVKSHFE